MIKNILIVMLLFSCSQAQHQRSNAGGGMSIPSQVPYDKNSEALKGSPSSFFYETTDGLNNFSAEDEIQGFISLCRSGRVTSGLKRSSEVYGKYKDWPSYWNGVGICFLSNNDFFKAQLYFNRSLELNKNYSPAINNLALILIKQEKWEEALVGFKEAYKANSRSQVVSYNLGRLYLAFGLGNKALNYFQKIEDTAFYRKHVAKWLAVSYALAGNFSEAENLFERVYGDHEKEEVIRLFYAYTLAKIGRVIEARKLLDSSPIGKKNNLYTLYQDIQEVIR